MKNSEPKPPELAISYLRFSSRKQFKNDSYRRQIEATEDYCRKNNLKLVERLEDLALSAFDGSNLDDTAALGDFLNKTRAGKIPKGTVLICENLDRLTRAGIFDALNLFSNILKAGIDIVTTMDNKRYSYESVKNNVGELIISITYLTRGNNESETKRNRVRQSWDNRIKKISNGEFAKHAIPNWLRRDGDKYVLIPERAETVQLIFDLYNEGRGAVAVVKELIKRNKKPFGRAKVWLPMTIHRMLQSKSAIGINDIVNPPVAKYYPPAVSENSFYKAQEQRRLNGNDRGHKGNGEVHLFCGLCRCSKCGGKMIKHYVSPKGRHRYSYLRCFNSKLGNGCDAPMMDFDKFQETFNDFFCSKEFTPFVQSRTQNQERDKTSEIKGRLLATEKQIENVSNTITEISKAGVTPTHLIKNLTTLERDKITLTKELDVELARVNSEFSTTGAYNEIRNNFQKHLKQPEFRLAVRKFMKHIIASIICDSDRYEVQFKNNQDVIAIRFLQQGYERLLNGKWAFCVTDFDAPVDKRFPTVEQIEQSRHKSVWRQDLEARIERGETVSDRTKAFLTKSMPQDKKASKVGKSRAAKPTSKEKVARYLAKQPAQQK